MVNFSIPSYVKNLAKSAGYIGIDVFKEYAPTMKSVISNTKETSEDLFMAIKDFTSSSSDFSIQNIYGKGKDIASNTWKNAIEDLKTGKIYNKERQDTMQSEMMGGVFGGDMDFGDINFDEEDWGDDDEDSPSIDAQVETETQIETSKAIIAEVDAVGRGLSASMTAASIESATYIAESAREDNIALYGLNKEGFGTMSKALMSINENICNFSKIGEPLTAHMQNSTVFFTTTTETLKSIEEHLAQIKENTKPAPVAGSAGYKKRRSLGSLMDEDEGINFLEIKEAMKEQIKENADMYSELKDMILPIIESGGKNVNILGSLATEFTKAIIPEAIKESVKGLDKSVNNFLGAALSDIVNKRAGDGTILGYLGELLPGRDSKRDVSLSSYEKGAVQWDGISRKALTDVIPTTLLQIYSVLSGTEPMRFDYNSGKYVKTSDITKLNKEKKKYYVEESGGDFYKDLKSKVLNSGKSEAEQVKMLKDLYEYFEKVFDTGDDNTNTNVHGINQDTFDFIKSEVGKMRTNQKSVAAKNLNAWKKNINVENENYGNFLRGEEASGFSLLQTIHDEIAGGGSSTKPGTKTTIIGLDQYGHNYYYYLQGIWQYTKFMTNNWGFSSGKGSSKNSNSGKGSPGSGSPTLPKINKVKLVSESSSGGGPGVNTLGTGGLTAEDSEEYKKAVQDEANKKAADETIKALAEDGKSIIANAVKKVYEFFGKDPDAMSPGLLMAAEMMDKFAHGMDVMLFDPDKGATEIIGDKLEEAFKNLKKKFIDKIWNPVKEFFKTKVFDPIKERLGESSWWQETKDTLGEMGKKIKGATHKIFFGNRAQDNGTAAYGRKVTKSGVVTVSEGELIIPSEFNPFYHGLSDKSVQIAREKRLGGGIPGFAKGNANMYTSKQVADIVEQIWNGNIPSDQIGDYISKLMAEGPVTPENIGEKIKNLKKNMNKLKDGTGKSEEAIANKAVEATKNKFKELKDGMGKTEEAIVNKVLERLNSSANGFIMKDPDTNKVIATNGLSRGEDFKERHNISDNSVFGILIDAAEGAMSSLKKKIDDLTTDENIQKDKEQIGGFVDNILKDVGGSKGEIGAGAIIGAGASIFTGIMGPIAGAALGATVGFISKSKTAQDFLFGPEDENGERKRQKAYDFFMKEVPGFGKGAALGTVAGTFMGSPLLGAFLGGAAGFAINNEKFCNFLFGETDEKGNRSGGILANKIFTHLDTTFRNIGNRLKVWFKDFNKSFKEKIFGAIDWIKEKLSDPKSFLGKIASKAIGWGGKIIKAPFQVMSGVTGKISEAVHAGNLTKGYSTYSKGHGRNMTAQERILARSRLNPLKQNKLSAKEFNNFDTFLTQIKDHDELERYKDIINEIKIQPTGSPDQEAAINALLNDKKYKDIMGNKGGKKFLLKNINKIEGLVKDEENRKGMTEADMVEQRDIKKVSLLERMTRLLECLAKGEQYTGPSMDEEAKGLNASEDPADNENRKTIFDGLGNAHIYERDEQGNWKEANNDGPTNESRGKINKLLDSIIGLPKNLFGKIKSLFNPEEENDKEKSPSWLSTVFDKFKGWAKEKLSAAKSFLSKILSPLSAIATAVATISLLINSLFGSEDNIINKAFNKAGELFGWGEPSENSEEVNGGPNDKGGTKNEFQDENGNTLTKDENGNYTDKNGNVVDSKNVQVVKAGKDTFLTNWKKGNLRQLVTGKQTGAGYLLKKGTSKLTKLIESNKFTNTIATGLKLNASNFKDYILHTNPTDIGTNVSKKIIEKDGEKLLSSTLYIRVTDLLDDLLTHLNSSVLIPSRVKSVLPNCFDDIVKAVAERSGKIAAAVSKGVQGVANNIGDLVPILNVAVAIADFVTGYEDARTTLGITKKPSEPVRLVAGLFRMLKNLIPIIGPFIPDDLVINIFCKWIAPVFGLKDSELLKDREEAKEQVASYNEEHGTDYSVSEYNKAVLHDYTFTERIGNAAKTTIQQTKDNWAAIKGSFEDAGGGVQGLVAGVKTAFQKGLPGIIGEIAEKNLLIKKYALEGNIEGIWETHLDGFYNGGETNEDGIETAIPSLFSKMVGELPIMVSKFMSTPYALVSKVGHVIWDKIKDFLDIDGITEVVSGVDNLVGGSNVLQCIADGDLSALWSYNAVKDNDNGFIGFLKILPTIPLKISATIPTLFSKAGHVIWDGILSPIIDKVKTTTGNFKQGFLEAFDAAYNDQWGLQDVTEANDDQGNPLSAFQKVVYGVGRISGGVFSLFVKAGEAITEKVKAIFTKVKNSVVTFGQTSAQIAINALTGHPINMWKQDTVESDPENPVGFFTYAILFLEKLIFTPISESTLVGRTIVEKVAETVGLIKGTIEIASNRASELHHYITEGNTSGLWDDEYEDEEGNPVRGVFKGIDVGVKLVMTPFAFITKVGNTIKEKVEEIKQPIVASIEKITENNLAVQKFVDDGNPEGLWDAETDFEDSPISGVSTAVSIGVKLVNTIPALVKWAGNGIKSAFDTFTGSIKEDVSSVKSYYDTLMAAAEKGKVENIVTTQFTTVSPFGGIFSFASSIIRLAAIFKAGSNWMGKKIEAAAVDAKQALSGSWFGKLLGFDSSSTTTNTNNTNTTKNNNKSGGASGLSTNGTCNNDKFVSQLDDRYKNIQFGSSTVGENGCGPAVAAMASSQAGGCLDMNTAIDKARKYTNNDGTSIQYFKDTLNATEIKGNAVKTALENGRPVILLGRDASNNNKSKSPFGPNNHYVLATSMKNGKILVNDPENDIPMVYDSSIINKSNVNLTYGGRSGFGKGTTGVAKSSTSDIIWNTLKGEGFSDAAAAGILGNAQQESSMSTTADAAAYGLFQFEKGTGSADALTSYANGLGKSKDDAEVQTKYMLSLFKDEIETYSGNGTHTYDNGTETWWPTKITLDEYKTLNDPQNAAEIFERTYERASIPMREQRKAYASDFYELYNGTAYDASKSGTSSSDSSSSDSSSSSSSSSGGILSRLTSIFGSLGNIFSTDGFSLNDDGSSSSSGNSSSGGVTNAKGAAAAAQAAENELGYAEQGDNITKFGAWSGCDGLPWCAAFSAWSIAQAFDGNKSSAEKALYNCENVNYCPTLVSTFKKNNAWYDEPEVGDEVLYSDNGDDAKHVGLVTSVDKNAKTFISVEGNTNDQVTKKEHSAYKDGSVYGFGRPDYTGANATIASNGNDNNGATMSGDEDFKATGSGLLRGKSSGILRKAAPSRFAYGKLKGQTLKYGKASGLTTKNRFSNANNDIKKTVTKTLSNFRTNLLGTSSYDNNSSGIDPALVADLLSSITSLLDSIANNTAPTEKIYDALTEYIDYVKGNKGTTTSSKVTEKMDMPKSTDDIDSNLAGLVSTLAAIARG